MKNTRFNIGQIVVHKTHGYSAVIIDVDGLFQPSGALNPHTIKKQFNKPGPWYRLLVHDTSLVTYVDESDLEIGHDGLFVSHPNIEEFLIQRAGLYSRKGGCH